ncbi:MAG: cytochrome c3 family protein [Candidatus Palauibacterales bacterium]|jgi:Cytochrome c7 and related cytochrome c|nr:cytochrome c3 family protein [Candidatus Palauibacterales bacterium]MDP2482428.1 cytochrome c3 family protein [Candidatus Palauibacterales bacterium]
MRRLAYLGAFVLALGAGALFAASRATFEFPHEKHAGLGASGCESCHAGIYSGDASRNVSVDPSLCSGCHNGQTFVEVNWPGYTPQESSLKFQHATHPKLGCQTCHGIPGAEGAMAVQPASGQVCLVCHGNGAANHFEVGVNPCETCHYDPAPGHTPEFKTQHGTAAAAGLPNCTQCHQQESFCVDCHDGPVNPRFQYHPANFVTRHGAEAWSEPVECAECHSREVFCRDCHSNQGVAMDGRQNGGYHDGVANWQQQHGVAARQGMDSCVSCHQQTECLACHSAKAGWRVNPHGPDFDPTRAEDRSTQACGICHTGY